MKHNSNSHRESLTALAQTQTASRPSKSKWGTCATLTVVGIAVVGLAGCVAGKYTGGGFIDSVVGHGQKATFAFNLEALDRDRDGQADQVVEPVLDPETGEFLYGVVWFTAKGQFNYKDHGAGVSFHADINETLELDENSEVAGDVWWNADLREDAFADGVLTESDLILKSMVFSGPYTSKVGSGRVLVTLTAENDSFGSAEDTIEVSLSGGPYDGYYNAGAIKGGNIQWHPAKSK